MKTLTIRSISAARVLNLRSAVAGVALALASAVPLAHGQAQIGADGHANDANNRAGSNGYNSAGTPANRSQSNTPYGTDNTPGLGGFHGANSNTDPNAFRGNSPDRSLQDFLNRGAPSNAGARSTGTPNYVPYTDPYGNPGRTSPSAASPGSRTPGDARLPAVGTGPQARSAASPNSASPVDPTSADIAASPRSTLPSMFGTRPARSSTTVQNDPFLDQPTPPATAAEDPAAPLIPAAQQSDQIQTLERRLAAKDAGAPFVITSLATGIKSPDLAKLLHDAEGQMRTGQYAQSVNTYDAAAAVAPNNPFIPLGRSFAELGANYYGKAEADLTRAIFAEPALLAARYDLKDFLGADRLKFIQKDLADIGSTELTARPHLLLAYIDHNTGADDTTATARDLDIAQSRGANPQLVELLRKAWDLKPAGK